MILSIRPREFFGLPPDRRRHEPRGLQPARPPLSGGPSLALSFSLYLSLSITNDIYIYIYTRVQQPRGSAGGDRLPERARQSTPPE